MALNRIFARALLATLLVGAAAPAYAQDDDATDTPAQDLYLRKRPPTGASVAIPDDLEPILRKKEAAAIAKRAQAIKLLEEFLATNPSGEAAAEGLFKLAELYWEDARRGFVQASLRYENLTEACRQRTEACTERPTVPKLDLSKSAELYQRLVDEHPSFRRIDLCKYLLGFTAYEDGEPEVALGWFKRVIDEHPDSTLYPDSWMMVGEFHFSAARWAEARDAYKNVVDDPESPVFDLALFKSAWCDWKLGDTKQAALRFKQVLDLASEAEKSGTFEQRKRRQQLRSEALEYLIVVFTEDENVTAKDAYDFLASIGGERYSREVITKLADTFYAQTRYDRAAAAYEFLIELGPMHVDAPKYRIAVIESALGVDDPDKALVQAKKLAEDYGEGSAWAKANKQKPKAIKRAHKAAELALRTMGKRLHAEAQQIEKSKRKPDLDRYKRAASVYAYYLTRFGKDAAAVEIRFLRAEILYFKLAQYESAGDEYLAVGKTAPVGKFHQEALLKGMQAFEKARPSGLQGKRELLPVDKKFAEAVDLYATLFPADPKLVDVVFKNGQLFFDYGEYDEAIKRFGLIVTKYPDHPDAGAAGDRILEALVKAEDFENVETWARKLKKAKAFQSREQQKRLDRLIAESISKAADKHAAAGEFGQAAKFYRRVADEYPKEERAPTALTNAAVVLEKAKEPEKAAATYLEVQKRWPKAKGAAKAAFTSGQVYEGMAYFDKAAEAYAIVATQYPDDPQAADALFNAGSLSQAQGRPKDAIKHYEAYAKRYREERKDAEDVAFRVAVVHEDAGDYGKAAEAFDKYTSRWRGGKFIVEAHARAARNWMKLGKEKQAEGEAKEAIRGWKSSGKEKQKKLARWAAEARYLEGELVFKTYERVSLAVKPKQLKKQLDKKTELLIKAQEIYIQVVEFGDAMWATAALYRIGQMFELFAEALKSAQVPADLTPEEQEVYRAELDTYVVDIEDRAIEAYKIGYQKALELKVYNQSTKNIRDALGRLSSTEFPPENESRADVRTGDRAPELEVMKDVNRGDDE